MCLQWNGRETPRKLTGLSSRCHSEPQRDWWKYCHWGLSSDLLVCARHVQTSPDWLLTRLVLLPTVPDSFSSFFSSSFSCCNDRHVLVPLIYLLVDLVYLLGSIFMTIFPLLIPLEVFFNTALTCILVGSCHLARCFGKSQGQTNMSAVD